jgi:hypothetical protein
MSDLLISGLLKRRSEIAADIISLSMRTADLQKDMAILDAALGVLGCEVEGEFLPAKKPTTAGLFRAKELPRLIFAELRKAPGGLEVADLADIIIRLKGWEPDDPRFVAAIKQKISRTLNKLTHRGSVVMDEVGAERLWRISG